MKTDEINKAAEKYADNIEVPATVGVMIPLLHDIAKDSYKQGMQDALFQQWISVEDRLPEPDTEVLAYIPADGYFRVKPYFAVLRYYCEDFCRKDGTTAHPAYWMPIPNPPKSEEK